MWRFVEHDWHIARRNFFQRSLAALFVRQKSEECKFGRVEPSDGEGGGESRSARNSIDARARFAGARYQPGTRVRNARRASVAHKDDTLPSLEPRNYFIGLFYFCRRVEPLQRLLDFISREQLRDDPRVLGINHVALPQRPQSAKRYILQIPYWRRDD